MPKPLAVIILAAISLAGLAIWAICSGHEDVAELEVLTFACILLFGGVCGIAFLAFEAIRSLFTRR